MQDVALVYSTWPSLDAAEQAGRALVDAKLCACVNILPGLVAIYRWQGKVERAEEAVMILKTRRTMLPALMDAVRAAHSYDTPAILELAVGLVDGSYASWIVSETGG